jgi:hypothetical protein
VGLGFHAEADALNMTGEPVRRGRTRKIIEEDVMPTPTEEITIRVDPEAAKAYRTAPEDQKRKMELLVGLQLHRFPNPRESLEEVTREASRQAQERGITPAILESILNEP